MRLLIAVPLLCTLLSACSAASRGGSDPPMAVQGCELAAPMDTGAWKVIRTGPFSFRLPPDYRQLRNQSIDSDFREWRARGGRAVDIDYGLYNGRFTPGPQGRMREPITECRAGDDRGAPQVVRFRTIEGGHAVGLYWVVPGGRTLRTGPNGGLQREALWLETSSPREEDLPELLTVVQSVTSGSN